MTPMLRMMIGFGVTFSVVITAVLAYRLAGWSWSDAIYMVVITIYGIGYGEVRPVTTPLLRGITISVIVFGYAAAIYTIGAFVQFLVDGELRKLLGIRRMQREIEKLRNHIVICGYGRMGNILAQSLAERGKKVLVLDQDSDKIRDAREAGYLALQGNATEEDVLKASGIEHASVLAAVLPNDAANVFLTIMAHELNPTLQIHSRAEHPSTTKKLRQVGATQVICPTQIGAVRFAHLILRPSAETILQKAKIPEGINQDLMTIGLEMDELSVGESSSLIEGTLGDIRLKENLSFLVVAVRNREGIITLSPTSSQKIRQGDVLIVLGQSSEIQSLCKRYSLQSELQKEQEVEAGNSQIS